MCDMDLIEVLMKKSLKQINKENAINKYFENQKNFGEYLRDESFVGYILDKAGYQIYDLNQAHKNFREVLKLDQINEIAGVYKTRKDGKIVEDIVSITKKNFWNAFYEPIWDNLNDADKIKALEWMFEDICETYNIKTKLTYIPHCEEDNSIYGCFFSEDNSQLFLNLNYINDLYDIVDTVAHELMHARQAKFAKFYDGKSQKDFYTISQLDENAEFNFNYTDMDIEENVKRALYRTSQDEKAAELQGLKTILKYKKWNEEKFGKNKKIDRNVKKFKDQMLLDIITDKKETDGIFTNEKITLKNQSENLLKLMMLKTYAEDILYQVEDDLEDVKTNIKDLNQQYKLKVINNKQYSKKIDEYNEKLKMLKEERKTYICKIEYIKSTFVYTLDNGKLPDDFEAEKEFSILKIKVGPKNENSLPKWLRDDEIRYSKKIEDFLKIEK